MPEIHYWMGVPLSEIPREELEQLFVEAWRKIDDLNGRNIQSKTTHINYLAAMRRRYGS